MTCVDCNAKTCGFNENCKCMKKMIDVEGLFAKSKIGTFCQSFKNPHGNENMKMEIAREMNNDESKTEVSCSANYCSYNENSICLAKNIRIGNEDAKYRSETQCDSFKLK